MQATADVKGQEKVAERGGERVEMEEGCCGKKCISHERRRHKMEEDGAPLQQFLSKFTFISAVCVLTFSGI